jgi:hypothetical protein
LFANGVLIFTKSVTPLNENLTFTLSKYGPYAQYLMTGNLSDVRVTTSIPTEYQTSSTTVGSSIFTPPTAPLSSSGTSLHIKGTDASIIDKSQGDNLKLVGNTTGSTTQVKFAGTKSMYFDGSGDYIRLEDLGTGALNTTSGFTIESWMYPIEWSAAQGNHALFGLNLISNGGNVLVFSAYGGGALYSGSGNVQTSSDVSINQWSHVACVVVGTSTKIYLNGSEVLSHTFANLSEVNWEDCILRLHPRLPHY